jgi:hypothetical protein
MNAIPVTPLTLEVARRIIWFEPPELALSDPIRFMAYAMTYARHEDMQEIRRYLSDDDIRAALDHAPAGIIDPRSWAYWNAKMGRYPAPPLPVRMFATSTGSKDQEVLHQHQTVRPNSGEKLNLENEQRAASRAWQQMRAQEPTKHDLEEVRRQARKNWRNKYGDHK